MSIIIALFLGLIQGLTEFLPISSSGHLMLFEGLLGLKGSNIFFNLILHFATLLAVVIVFWKDVIELIKHPFGEKMRKIVVATIPTVILALIVKFAIDEFTMVVFLGYGFLVSAVVIFTTFMLQKKQNLLINKNISYKQSFIIGLVQGFAVLPGISRSGSTICAGLLQGVDREECAKFSFLISIPVILGGVIFETADGFLNGFGNVLALPSIIGFLVAFIVALFTIKLMMRVVKKGNWLIFAIYLFVLAGFVLLNQYVLCLF
ncbi:MAG: undecaprenyl-diphosphate phosphatase [Clostridia bacterium]|nr:undecaprenyl-diphosphate phosphatase [Clostridia bacterium]